MVHPMAKTKKPKFKFRASQLKMFWYWMRERHAIYLKRFKEKEPHPWTKDKILTEYKFTNVYRQLDRVSLAWQDRYVHLLNRGKKLKNSDILFHCIMFRLFNLPETYDALFYGITGRKDWNLKKAIKILEQRRDEDHEQIFTGAYIVSNGNRTESKIQVICEAVDYAYKRKIRLANKIKRKKSMEKAVEILQCIPTVGSFVAYEIACDLRFTKVLNNARDVLAWANPGPGAKRGIRRLLYGSAEKKGGKPIDWNSAMRELLTMVPKDLQKHLDMTKEGVPFEMREIEHSLCEFDKYMRVKNGEGKPRSRYRPPIDRHVTHYKDDE